MKTIGVCLARVQDEVNRKYLEELLSLAQKRGDRLLIFHSIFSYLFKEELIKESGSKEVFSHIPFQELDALLILHDTVFDQNLIRGIMEDAHAYGVPVLNLRGRAERCYNILSDYADVYEEIISHVIEKSKNKNFFYIAGREKDDVDSNGRLAVFKKALEKAGLEFSPSKVAYGEYWEGPVPGILDNLLKNGELPEAIFCANDIMALAVMDHLSHNGYSVPKDCMVTGFDGIESGKNSALGLTSCYEDYEDASKVIFDLIDRIASEQIEPGDFYHKCGAYYADSTRDSVNEQETNRFFHHRRCRAVESDEDANNFWLDTVIETPNMSNLRRCLPAILKKGRALIIREDSFIGGDSDTNMQHQGQTLPPKMLLIARDTDDNYYEKQIRLMDINQELSSLVPAGHAGYLSSITMHDVLYGFAFESTTDAYDDGDCINRYTRTLCRALIVSAGGERQLQLAHQLSEAKYVDAVTGLRNIDGLSKWYAQLCSEGLNKTHHLSLGIYTFMTYQDVFNKAGMDVLENCLQYIASSLSMAAPEDSIIARISADSFVVARVFPTDYNAAKDVDDTITMFYGFLDLRNKSDKTGSHIEVSCGYTDSDPVWNSQISYYIDEATSILYMNRLAFSKNLPSSVDREDGAKILEYRAKLIALIKDNLFIYHFQPIVDAHSGKIVAYEALMRTTQEIGLTPPAVLSAAEMYGKLPQVEWATFNNVLSRIQEAPSLFEGKNVFINSVPGHFLRPGQIETLREAYGDLLSQVVIEITESETISEEELSSMRSLSSETASTRIAVDDYGTGHSNVVNLLRYKPELVKIDRFLVTDIHKDHNKQIFVKNIIEFSRENNILTLAEGVETKEELQTVIAYGVDFIQGYYTARPAFEVLQELPEDIVEEIRSFQP